MLSEGIVVFFYLLVSLLLFSRVGAFLRKAPPLTFSIFLNPRGLVRAFDNFPGPC